MPRTVINALCIFAVLVPLSTSVPGQVATGTPPFGSFGGGPFDTVNLGNLNVHFGIPVLHKAGRGMPFTYDLSYDSSVWYPTQVSGNPTWQHVTNWGWRGVTEIVTGYVSYMQQVVRCPNTTISEGAFYTEVFRFEYHDSFGVVHSFTGVALADSDCPNGPYDRDLFKAAIDGSGYTLYYHTATQGTNAIVAPSGEVINPPWFPVTPYTGAGRGTATDTNGNQVTTDGYGRFYDTLSSTEAVFTVSGEGTDASPMKFTYTAPSGAPAPFIMNYTNYNIQTAFGCSVGQYTSTSPEPLVTSIVLPDGSKYIFTYEDTPGVDGYKTGRLTSVTLPTGGSIQYTYNGDNGGINCADGSTVGLTRTTSTTSPGSTTEGQWTYSRSGADPTWTTTISDKANNTTSLSFSKSSNNFYETQRTVTDTSLGLLKTIVTCYNISGTPDPTTCPGATVSQPITRRTVFSYLPDLSGLRSEADITYDSSGSGLVQEVDEYDFGGSTPQRKTITKYAPLDNGIIDHVESVTVKDANNAIVAQTMYRYDETNVAPTSGIPQHVSITGSRGNLTSSTTLASSYTGTYLYRQFTYYDTGMLNTSTDLSTSNTVPGPTTTYSYDANTSCSNSFPTSVSGPMGLSRSMTWNCTGGVQTSATDENGRTESYSYSADPYFWRPDQSTDRTSNVTTYGYTPTTLGSTLALTGTAAVDVLTTLDGLGRPQFVQQRSSGNTFDSVQTDYDANGRAYRASMPYGAGAGLATSGPWRTTIGFDALNRSLSVGDDGGGATSYSYVQNDVYVTVGPAPTGEKSKRKQFEYDGLGRLKSVCEITDAAGSGPCQQTSKQTGYWTQYTYDALGNITGVNQSGQTRNFSYDSLGRLTSEANPETGMVPVKYYYDGPIAACQNYTSAGDLIERLDAAGNVTCYYYDTLHRLTDSGYGGPVCRRFRYDKSVTPPSGISVANTNGRLLEAFTDNCSPNATKITDEWFSYSPRGELTDIWESTPNSDGYYHVTGSYWPHGGLQTLGGLPGLPRIYYGASDGSGLDGEGRVTKVTEGDSLRNLVTSVSYNTAGQPTGVTLGSGDTDSFTYDPKTGRLTDFQSNVGTQPLMLSGGLTWNTNASLGSFVIADNCNVQTCNYAHDDLARIASVDCGDSVFKQSFSYPDPFGNIKKAGSFTWDASYDTSTNRYLSVPGATPSYDANGNLTADGSHIYAWDPNWGNPASIDSVNLVYDALGRMVEQNRGGVYTQMVYAPSGAKLALMNGQTLVKAFVPLPSGGTAVYTSSGLSYYRHPDWLGSSRLATTPDRKVYAYAAYAPFGESYGKPPSDPSFTGQNQDTAPGLYDFMYREYHPVSGRWISPDPAGLAAANPTDPQSWNRYVYVGNNPASSVDWLGLKCPRGEKGGCGTGNTWWGWDQFWLLSFAAKATFGIITPLEPGSEITSGALVLYLYYGNWDLAMLFALGFPEPSYIGHQLGPNVRSLLTCAAGLKKSGNNLNAVSRATSQYENLSSAATAAGVDWSVLAAMGIRESGFHNIWELGGGPGRGIYQIDAVKHPEISDAQAFDPAFNIAWTGANFANSLSKYSLLGPMAVPAAIRAHNAGDRYTFGKGAFGVGALDRGTAPLGRGNYVSNVLQMADCFQ